MVISDDENEKKEYLQSLFVQTYLRDIKDRYSIQLDHDLEELIDVIASGIGSLTNPHKIQNTFRTVKQSNITQDTIKNYLDYMQDAFIINKAVRYDIKGRRYIDTPAKYYFEDLGLRNARLHFRQTEETHLMGFQKVVIVGGMQPTYRNDDGILILNIFDFLLGKVSI